MSSVAESVFGEKTPYHWTIKAFGLQDVTKELGIVKEVPEEYQEQLTALVNDRLANVQPRTDARGSLYTTVHEGAEFNILTHDGKPNALNFYIARANHKHPNMHKVIVVYDPGQGDHALLGQLRRGVKEIATQLFKKILLGQAPDNKRTMHNNTMGKWTCTVIPKNTYFGVATPVNGILLTFTDDVWKDGCIEGRTGRDPEYPVQKGDLTTDAALQFTFPEETAQVRKFQSTAFAALLSQKEA